jgi:hypothetical protein
MEQHNAPREWTAFSENRADGKFITIEKWEEAMLFSGVPKSRIVTVRLIEDPAGDYMGWLDTNDKGEICMVQHKRVFPIQFAYGVEAAVENGDGVPVSLRIEVA